MEKELGRPVSIGEVFIRSHTKSDGTFVDAKSKQIAETYEKNMEDKMSEIMQDPSDCSSELSKAAKDDIFINSTVVDDRGNKFVLGSLGPRYGRGKRKGGPGSSTTSMFSEMQEQLHAAQRQIEEEAAANAQLHAEWTRFSGEQGNRISSLEMVISYLQSTDPRFSDYVAAHFQSSTAGASAAGASTAATSAAPITPAAPLEL